MYCSPLYYCSVAPIFNDFRNHSYSRKSRSFLSVGKISQINLNLSYLQRLFPFVCLSSPATFSLIFISAPKKETERRQEQSERECRGQYSIPTCLAEREAHGYPHCHSASTSIPSSQMHSTYRSLGRPSRSPSVYKTRVDLVCH